MGVEDGGRKRGEKGEDGGGCGLLVALPSRSPAGGGKDCSRLCLLLSGASSLPRQSAVGRQPRRRPRAEGKRVCHPEREKASGQEPSFFRSSAGRRPKTIIVCSSIASLSSTREGSPRLQHENAYATPPPPRGRGTAGGISPPPPTLPHARTHRCTGERRAFGERLIGPAPYAPFGSDSQLASACFRPLPGPSPSIVNQHRTTSACKPPQVAFWSAFAGQVATSSALSLAPRSRRALARARSAATGNLL